jgi:hypothetical protein
MHGFQPIMVTSAKMSPMSKYNPTMVARNMAHFRMFSRLSRMLLPNFSSGPLVFSVMYVMMCLLWLFDGNENGQVIGNVKVVVTPVIEV